MSIPWSTLIWLAIVVFVYVFGIYEGRGQGYKKRKAEEEQERRDKPAAPAAPVKVDDPGLLRIKSEQGFLTLDLDGTRVDTAALTVDQRKRLIEMLSVIRPWLEGKSAPAPAAPPAVPPAARPAPVTAASGAPVPPPAAGLSPAAARPAVPEKEAAAPQATGIVGQIETILQARLAGTALDGRGIHLSNSPEGGVIVNVGEQKFYGIDEVTDPDIKAILRAAVSEWERKYTPGL